MEIRWVTRVIYAVSCGTVQPWSLRWRGTRAFGARGRGFDSPQGNHCVAGYEQFGYAGDAHRDRQRDRHQISMSTSMLLLRSSNCEQSKTLEGSATCLSRCGIPGRPPKYAPNRTTIPCIWVDGWLSTQLCHGRPVWSGTSLLQRHPHTRIPRFESGPWRVVRHADRRLRSI